MKYIFMFLVIVTFSTNTLAFEAGPAVTEREIIESLTELKIGNTNMNERFNDLRNEMKDGYDKLDKRIDDSYNKLDKQINDSYNKLDKRMDNLNNLLLWGFGIIFTGLFAVIGFVIWDRKTALSPAVKKHDALESAIIGYSEKHPDMKEELKHAGVL